PYHTANGSNLSFRTILSDRSVSAECWTWLPAPRCRSCRAPVISFSNRVQPRRFDTSTLITKHRSKPPIETRTDGLLERSQRWPCDENSRTYSESRPRSSYIGMSSIGSAYSTLIWPSVVISSTGSAWLPTPAPYIFPMCWRRFECTLEVRAPI